MNSLCHICVASDKLGPQPILPTLFFPSIFLGSKISFVITHEPQAHTNSRYSPGLSASFLGDCIFLVKWLCRISCDRNVPPRDTILLCVSTLCNKLYLQCCFFSEISLYGFLNAEDFHAHSSAILCIQNIGLGQLRRGT